MNKQEIENLIEKYDNLVDEIQTKVEETQGKIEIMQKLKKEIQEQLAEKPNPKLRHGDYGYDKDGEAAMIVRLDGNEKMTAMTTEGVYENLELPLISAPTTILGNIFDDLNAKAEPLEEFEMHPAFGGRKVEISGKKTGGIWMGIMNTYDTLDKKGARLSLAEAEEIHRSLGRVIAFAKTQQ